MLGVVEFYLAWAAKRFGAENADLGSIREIVARRSNF